MSTPESSLIIKHMNNAIELAEGDKKVHLLTNLGLIYSGFK